MTKEYTLSREEILKIATKSKVAKDVLKTMFPDAFKPEKVLKEYHTHTVLDTKFIKHIKNSLEVSDANIIQIRDSGKHASNGFWLTSELSWEIVKDDCGETVLIFKKIV